MPGELREAEVEYLRPAVVCQEDVGRFDIPVDDALSVGRLQTPGDVDSEPDRLIDGHGALLQTLSYRLTFIARQNEEELSVLGLLDLVDRAYVGMVEPGSGLSLREEPVLGTLVASEFGGEELERDRALEPGVLGPVDDAHAAAAEFLDDPVMADGLADHSRRSGRSGPARSQTLARHKEQRLRLGVRESRGLDRPGSILPDCYSDV